MTDLTSSRTLPPSALPWGTAANPPTALSPALVVAWYPADPSRVGEVIGAPPHGETHIFGRGDGKGEGPRARLVRQRPGANSPRPPLDHRGISREQLALQTRADGVLEFRSIGRGETAVNGERLGAGLLRPGDVLALKNQLLLLVCMRPATMPPLRNLTALSDLPFATADPYGIVGESPSTWKLRDQLAFAGASEAHVLLLGDSGVGKELAATAIHAQSARSNADVVARNAATIPATLVDAELFGNARDYPNAGMAERPGIIGQADGSTLFLDEIGELATDLQAHLLRVVDSGGEYQRLGESTMRRSDFRLVAATNRDVAELKHDLAARLGLRVSLPGLQERREDIPLIARHLMHRLSRRNPQVATRFFEGDEPRIGPELMLAALRMPYTHHVRQLEGLLWESMTESPGHYLDLPPSFELPVAPTHEGDESDDESQDAPAPSREVIAEALERHDGNVTHAARDLGLKNRYVLYRLIKKYQL